MTPATVIAGAAAVSAISAYAARGTSLPWLAAIAAEPRGERRRGGSRDPDAEAELPLLLDLLATATAAGMSGSAAFGAAAAALRGDLGSALRTVVASASLGSSLAGGIREAATALDLPDLARAGSVLERSGSLGVPVSVALRELAAEHRRGRRRLAEQRARTAPVRMLFPLVFLVLPAFLLLTVVPMLLATLGSLS